MKNSTKEKLSKIRLYSWYSICSIHHPHKKGCEMCDTGSWILVRWLAWDHWLYKISPKLWRKWANRKGRKKMSERFSSKETGERDDKGRNY